MSGALSAIGAASGSPLVSGVLGLLQTASFRGVVFEVFDSTNSAGRRWQEFLFPGRADTVWEDLGALNGPIAVNAVLIGDDYVSRARRLERACLAAGPATLRHPWLGSIKVVLAEPASFAWDGQAQRMCKVAMTFKRWQPAPPPSLASLSGLFDAVGQLMDDVQGMVADVLAPVGAALGLLGFAQGALQTVAGVVNGAIGGAPNTASAAALAGLSGGTPSAVPGGVATIAAGAAAILLAIPDLLAGAAAGAPGQHDEIGVVLLAARIQAAAAAAQVAASIPWTSRDEAAAWRNQVDAVLAKVQSAAATPNLPGLPGLRTGAVWLALRQLRTAWGADVGNRAGPLPAVRFVVTAAPMSAWLIAQAVAGDTPSAVRSTMLDLVARNRVRHPGRVPAGRLELVVA